ncbi:MAG: aminotransferase class V-fold PLP-dependent enzyme, partial [Chloroflexales bacterium]
APHRGIDMGDLDDPAHLDYLAISGHKLYAPYGSGALIGRADTFALGAPLLVGGGSVRRVTPQIVDWSDGPARDEAGTPNVVGAVAMAAALAAIDAIGMDAIAAHEAGLTAHAIERLRAVPGLRLYGDDRPQQAHTRLGVLPFSLSGHNPHLVAAILSCEYGIAVRSGSFCAQPYLRSLLDTQHVGCSPGAAGLVRASLGIYNTSYEVDLLADALAVIAGGAFDSAYQIDPKTGIYHPHGWRTRPAEHFNFDLAPGSRLAAEAVVCAD